MSPQPQDSDKARRRKPRKAPADQNTADDSVQTDEDTTKLRPKSQHKKKAPQHHESALTRELQEAGAVTPPRSQGRNANNATDGEQPGHQGQKSMRKKRNDNSGTHNPNVSHRQNRKATPSKPNMDAYAGPTFHASPAPSALPIPKMFSKSAPTADKDTGITARLQQEEGNASGSDNSPDSPSVRPSASRMLSQGHTSAGPALFDMLMNADRQEKAQLQRQTLSPPQNNTRENSVSPVHAQSLHRPKHSRTLTDTQIFPLEASTANQQSPSPAPNRQMPPQYLGSPFNNSPHTQSDSGNLKRMLFSSPQQAPPLNAYYGGPVPGQWNSSPASRGTPSPYASPSSANGLATSSRPAPVSPYTQASPSPSSRHSGFPPHSNSNLRRELSPGGLNHTPPSLGSLPRYNAGNAHGSPLASPTYQRYNNRNSPFGGPGHDSPDRNGSPSGNKRFSAQDALKSLGGANQMTEMEDRLRQILKIDQLRPQGASGTPAGIVPS